MSTPWCSSAPLDSSRLSTERALLSLTFLGRFASFGGITSPSSTSYTFLFLFKSRLGSIPTSVIGRGGGGRLRGTWVLGTSLEVDPLFLLASKPFKLVLCFKSIPPSSSSELVSTRATINLREWVVENLSKSALEFESSTGLFGTSRSSWRWNWLISASRDKGVEAISSLGAATSWGMHWMGSSTGGSSLRAKNSGLEMSMRANLESPALIAWPTSWNMRDRGS